MWAILVTIMFNSSYDSGVAATTNVVGEYVTVSNCETVAKQLRGRRKYAEYEQITSARCIQIKDKP